MAEQEFMRAQAVADAVRAYEKMREGGQAIVDALEPAAAAAPDVLALAGLDQRFVVSGAGLPRAPTAQELAALPTGHILTGAYFPAGWQRVEWSRTLSNWVPTGDRTATGSEVEMVQDVAQGAKDLAEQARTVATLTEAASSNLGAANTVIVRDPVRGGVFNRDAAQSGAAIPGVRYQWGGVWFTRQRAGKEWRLTHVDAAGEHGGDWAAAIKSLIPYFDTNDRLIIPEGEYLLKSGFMVLKNLGGLQIIGDGANLTFDPSLPPTHANTGFILVDMLDFVLRGFNMDGRLDVRTSLGGDAGENFLNNIAIIEGCRGGLVEDVYSTRSMMDGFYIGHNNVNLQALSASTPDRWPAWVEFNRCTADYNYRQGLSATASYDCTDYNGDYGFSGALGIGKGTPPMAGVDIESENADGWGNWRFRLYNTKAHGNKGRGISLDTHAYDCLAQSVSAQDNTDAGIATAIHASGCTIRDAIIKNNTPTAGEGQVGLYGLNNKVLDSQIVAQPGTPGISATATGGGGHRTIMGNVISVGGAHAGNRSGTLSVQGTNDVVQNNTIIGGTETAAVTGVLDVRSPGGTVTGNRIINPVGSNASWPVLIEAAMERDNVSIGYTGPRYLDATGKPATPPLIAPALGGSDTVTAAAYNQLLEEVRSLRQAVKDGGVTR